VAEDHIMHSETRGDFDSSVRNLHEYLALAG
jgi:hypothetical protein